MRLAHYGAGVATTRVGETLRNRAVTQADVAELLGVTQSTVSRKLSGQSEWRLTELQTLAQAWGIPLGQLLEAEPSIKRENRVSAAPSTGVRRRQTSAGPVPPLEQPSPKPDLNGRGKRSRGSG